MIQHTDGMDYYALLGVERSSPPEAITHAYRRLAREYHPDLHPQDAEADTRFKQINEAYRVLSDPEKREQYDQQLTGSQPTSPSTAHTGDEQTVGDQQAAVMQGKDDIEGVVGELAATLEEFANQAADEMRRALLDFGAEVDSMTRTFRDTMGSNRAMRRGFPPPPPQNLRPPRDGRPPYDGRPPRDGSAPKR